MPANLVNLESVRKAYGERVLLDGVSLGVAAGERIGVVGPNGAGKTTLVSVLAGALPPDTGRVTHARGLAVGVLPQADLVAEGTVREAVVGDAAEHEWASDPRIRAVLDGLGLRGVGLDAPLARRSGGERRRVGLASVLVRDADLVVLDEPTNHLDVEAVAWLAEHLRARRSALVVVTHDRWFLDAVCERTWEVADGRVHAYEGGYAAYVLARAERERVAAATEERRRNLVRKELAWLRRGPQARTSKPKFRVEAANALITDVPPPRDRVELLRFAATRIGRTVYELHDVTLRLGDALVVDRLTWHVGPGDRIGLVGVNGAGKTSLLRLLTGELRPDSGKVVVGRTVRPAHLSQGVEELDPDERVLEAVEAVRRVVRIGKREFTASQVCEALGFGGDRQWTPVRDLSGGERRRLQIVRLLMSEPNVLLLDEPTNDLDIDTLTAVEDLLDGWPGTLLVVSHDRYFLERVTDQTVAVMGDGTLPMLPGGVEEYLERRRTAAVPAAAPRPPAGPRGGDAQRERQAKKELARLERQLERLQSRESELHEQLAAHATDHERLAELDRTLRDVRAERDRTEERWLELAETAD
ncbi:MAG: ABC-F family ATP-binding cassette domain-containing protein [Streptosporangiales bacterium]|nr:ABC-F family ATP-binding cassette domain-containing protein [Streptosporangiales bacterium]